jgi:hypothetical protein
LLVVSRACKTPANSDLPVKTPFSSAQEIYSGCCTVATH